MTVSKSRKPIVAGNWKMNKTVADATDLVNAIKRDLAGCKEVDVVLCPPFTALKAVSDLITETHIDLGAQNMHWEKNGAFTGEVSAEMIRELYCHYVILGHSERRAYFGETDEIVNKKTKAALEANLTPIVCVGETLDERESGRMTEVVQTQVRGSLKGLSARDLAESVIAYEPVWAIGTGLTPTIEDIAAMHRFIRQKAGAGVRILYGGSVKPSNAAEILAVEDVNGALVGGASLKADDFYAIISAA